MRFSVLPSLALLFFRDNTLIVFRRAPRDLVSKTLGFSDSPRYGARIRSRRAIVGQRQLLGPNAVLLIRYRLDQNLQLTIFLSSPWLFSSQRNNAPRFHRRRWNFLLRQTSSRAWTGKTRAFRISSMTLVEPSS